MVQSLIAKIPSVPRLGVAALIYHQDSFTEEERRILMGRRGKTPNKGKWVFPGGGIKFGESLIKALYREVQEETNIDPNDLKLGKEYWFPLQIRDQHEHRIVLCREVSISSRYPTIKACSDLTEVKWFTYSELLQEKEISDAIIPALHHFGW